MKHSSTLGIIISTVLLFAPWAWTAVSEVERYSFSYKTKVELPPGTKKIRLWLPYPKETAAQQIHQREVKSSLPWKITEEKRFGNRFLFLEGAAINRTVEVSAVYDITRKRYPGILKDDITKGSFDDPIVYREAEKQVPFAPVFKKIVAEETSATDTSQQKVRKLYEYIVRTMKYDKSGEGWGQGNAIWACTEKRGNCTDFHSLFIGLARTVNVPARFIIGFPIPSDKNEGTIGGYHCWAEAFSSEKGWIPLDASEAKKSGRIDEYFGQLPADRLEFAVGRDLMLEPRQKGEPLNYFIYPYGEIDDRPIEKFENSFEFKRQPSHAS